MHGKRQSVETLINEEVKIKPKMIYRNENGKEKTSEFKPISITVKELGLKGWLEGER